MSTSVSTRRGLPHLHSPSSRAGACDFSNAMRAWSPPHDLHPVCGANNQWQAKQGASRSLSRCTLARAGRGRCLLCPRLLTLSSHRPRAGRSAHAEDPPSGHDRRQCSRKVSALARWESKKPHLPTLDRCKQSRCRACPSSAKCSLAAGLGASCGLASCNSASNSAATLPALFTRC